MTRMFIINFMKSRQFLAVDCCQLDHFTTSDVDYTEVHYLVKMVSHFNADKLSVVFSVFNVDIFEALILKLINKLNKTASGKQYELDKLGNLYYNIIQ